MAKERKSISKSKASIVKGKYSGKSKKCKVATESGVHCFKVCYKQYSSGKRIITFSKQNLAHTIQPNKENLGAEPLGIKIHSLSVDEKVDFGITAHKRNPKPKRPMPKTKGTKEAKVDGQG